MNHSLHIRERGVEYYFEENVNAEHMQAGHHLMNRNPLEFDTQLYLIMYMSLAVSSCFSACFLPIHHLVGIFSSAIIIEHPILSSFPVQCLLPAPDPPPSRRLAFKLKPSAFHNLSFSFISITLMFRFEFEILVCWSEEHFTRRHTNIVSNQNSNKQKNNETTISPTQPGAPCARRTRHT